MKPLSKSKVVAVLVIALLWVVGIALTTQPAPWLRPTITLPEMYPPGWKIYVSESQRYSLAHPPDIEGKASEHYPHEIILFATSEQKARSITSFVTHTRPLRSTGYANYLALPGLFGKELRIIKPLPAPSAGEEPAEELTFGRNKFTRLFTLERHPCDAGGGRGDGGYAEYVYKRPLAGGILLTVSTDAGCRRKSDFELIWLPVILQTLTTW